MRALKLTASLAGDKKNPAVAGLFLKVADFSLLQSREVLDHVNAT